MKKHLYVLLTISIIVLIIAIAYLVIHTNSTIKVNNFSDARDVIKKSGLDINLSDFDDGIIQQGSQVCSYQLTQKYNGVDIYGADIVVYTDSKGNKEGIIDKSVDINIDTSPKSSQNEIANALNEELGFKCKIDDSKLIIFPYESEYILAHMVDVYTSLGNITVVVSDDSQEIIAGNLPQTAKYALSKEEKEAFSLGNGSYTIQDKSRNIVMYDLNENDAAFSNFPGVPYSWQDGDNLDKDTLSALTAMSHFRNIYDYYLYRFNYLGLDGKGQKEIQIYNNIKNYTSYDGKYNYSDNAFFLAPNTFALGSDHYYNDSPEVIAHEYTHAVFYYKTGGSLTEEGSAVNESFADVIGMCYEANTKGKNKIDGKIQDIPTSRDIANSKNKYSSNFGEAHSASTILSRVAYNMNDVLTANEISQIWFNSMNILGTDPSFKDAKKAIIETARIMQYSDKVLERFEEEFSKVGLGDKKQTSSSGSNSNLMSESEALKLGKDLYKKANQSYWGAFTFGTDIISDNDTLMEYIEITNLEDFLNLYTAKGFKQFKDQTYVYEFKGKYYVPYGDRGMDIEYQGNELSIDKIETDKITFTSIEKYDNNTTPIVKNKFIIAKENNTWKIEEFTLPN